MSEIVNYKNLKQVESVSDVLDSDTVLVERKGLFKRIPARVVGNTDAVTEAVQKADTALEQLPLLGDSQEIHYLLENTDIDTTLTKEGKVPDAKVVGDKIEEISSQVPIVQSSQQIHKVLEADDIDAT